MQGLGAAGAARWVALAGVGDKNAGDEQRQPEDEQQPRPPDGAFARPQHLPQTDGEAEHERSADQETNNLDPALAAQAEAADHVAPGAVEGAGGVLDEEHQDEEQGTDHAAGEHQSNRSGEILGLMGLDQHYTSACVRRASTSLRSDSAQSSSSCHWSSLSRMYRRAAW